MQTDNYIAFGLSGSESGVSMFGSDVTWTWMNNEGVHAEELNINAYSQVNLAEYETEYNNNNIIVNTYVVPDYRVQWSGDTKWCMSRYSK